MFCTKCGNEVEEGILYCPVCGARIIAPGPIAGVTPDIPLDDMEPVDLTKAPSVQQIQEEEIPVSQQTYYNPVAENSAPQQTYYNPVAENSAPQQTYYNPAAENSATQQTYYNPAAENSASQQTYYNPAAENSATQQTYYNPAAENSAPQQTYYSQSSDNGGQQNYQTSYNQNVNNMLQPKPKKKGGLIAAIVAVLIVAVLGLTAAFMWPDIQMIIKPEAQAKSALKTSVSSIEEKMNDAFSAENLSMSTKSVGKQSLQYVIKLDKAQVAEKDFTKYLKADTIVVDMEVSPEDKVIAGKYGIRTSGSQTSVLEMPFYMDSSKFYFKIPALFEESFVMSTDDIFDEMGISYNQIFQYMGGSGSSMDMSAYSGIIQPIVKDVFDAMDVLIDSATYKRVGKVKLNGAQGNISATQLTVTITEDNIKGFANAVVDNIYNDDSLKALFALMGAGKGFNKDYIKKQISNADLGIDSISFEMYLNRDKELVRFLFDTRSMAGYVNDDFKIDIQFLGKKNIYDSVRFGMYTDDVEVLLDVTQSDNNVKLDFNAKPLDNSKQFITMSCDMSVDSNSDSMLRANINNMSVSGNIDGSSFDIAMSGTMSGDSISSIKTKVSDFANPINPERMTSAQQYNIIKEVSDNFPVLKNVLSDDIYNQLYRSAFGLSSSGSGYRGLY